MMAATWLSMLTSPCHMPQRCNRLHATQPGCMWQCPDSDAYKKTRLTLMPTHTPRDAVLSQWKVPTDQACDVMSATSKCSDAVRTHTFVVSASLALALVL